MESIITNILLLLQKALPKKGYIRGVSYLTGYLVRKMEGNKCQFTYVSQSDPKGKDTCHYTCDRYGQIVIYIYNLHRCLIYLCQLTFSLSKAEGRDIFQSDAKGEDTCQFIYLFQS